MTPTPQAPQAPKFTPYQIIVIVLLALTQFTVILDFMVMSPLGDMLMKSMNLSTKQFAISVSCYAFSAGISGLLTAGFADRFDRKKLLLFFYVGFILGTLSCGLVNSYPMLVAARIITGLFGGVIGSIAFAIVADIFLLQQRGRVMGFMQMGLGASQVLGIPISLYLAYKWGWQSPFIMIVGLGAIVWIGIIIKLKPITEHLKLQTDSNFFLHLWHTVKQRDYRIGFLGTAFLSIGGFMMMPWSSAFSVNNLGVTEAQLPLLFMISGLASLVIMPVIGRVSDKVDKYKIFFGASVFMMVMVTIYTHLTPVPFWIVVLMNILFMMGIMSRMVPAMAMTSALPEMKDRGAFMSVNSSLQQMAGGIAAVVGGLIVVQKDKYSPLEHYDTLGYVIVAVTILCLFLIYRVSVIIKSRSKIAAANHVKTT